MPVKFEVSLVYIESFRTARLLGGNPHLKNKQIRKNKQMNNKTLTKNNKSAMRSVASLSSLLWEVEVRGSQVQGDSQLHSLHVAWAT